MTASTLRGRLVLPDRVVRGAVLVEDDRIAAIEVDEDPLPTPLDLTADEPLLVPGFVDVHCHGWGGHDAMDGPAALDGMARALARRGVTSFLPTGVSVPLPVLARFAADVRAWQPAAPADGAAPLGFNFEGPFLAAARKGAHDPAFLRDPASLAPGELEPLLDGLRLATIAPERPGALELIAALVDRGVRVSIGHSAATLAEARAGYAAGATTTTHLFNAMTGIDHRAPGVAVAALTDDAAYVELIADGHHVDPALWPIVVRTKPAWRLLLVSDAISMAGTGDGRATIGGLDVEIVGGRVTLAGTTTLAGSVIALDDAVRNLVAAGIDLPTAVAAAATNPCAMLNVDDRGRIEGGLRADLVELGPGLGTRRVMLGGTWLDA